jgi:hypothetical protein
MPPINRSPRDGGGCHSVTWACPNASWASPMLPSYEQRGRHEVDDNRWVNFWKVIRLSGLKVIGFRCGPWNWYRGGEGEYIWTRVEWERIGEVRKGTNVPLQTPGPTIIIDIPLPPLLLPLELWTGFGHIGTGPRGTMAPSTITWMPTYRRLGTRRLGTTFLCISL